MPNSSTQSTEVPEEAVEAAARRAFRSDNGGSNAPLTEVELDSMRGPIEDAAPALLKQGAEEAEKIAGRLRGALQELQNGPDTLTQDGLRIVNEALAADLVSAPVQQAPTLSDEDRRRVIEIASSVSQLSRTPDDWWDCAGHDLRKLATPKEGRGSDFPPPLLKAAHLLALTSYEECVLPDDLYADPYCAEKLLACGTDYSGEGYTQLTNAGVEFIRQALEDAALAPKEEADHD